MRDYLLPVAIVLAAVILGVPDEIWLTPYYWLMDWLSRLGTMAVIAIVVVPILGWRLVVERHRQHD